MERCSSCQLTRCLHCGAKLVKIRKDMGLYQGTTQWSFSEMVCSNNGCFSAPNLNKIGDWKKVGEELVA